VHYTFKFVQQIAALNIQTQEKRVACWWIKMASVFFQISFYLSLFCADEFVDVFMWQVYFSF
jgi:hypothetical protein